MVDLFAALYTGSGELDYDQMWISVQDLGSLPFGVRACNDAHLGLFSILENNTLPMYEVVIGGWSNTQSAIRLSSQGLDVVLVSTPGILSCAEFRSLWISWQDSHIQVGRGDVVGANIFMEWEDTEYSVTVEAVSLSTGWGASGEWQLGDLDGELSPLKWQECGNGQL